MAYDSAITLLRKPMLYGEYKEIPDFVEKPLMTKKDWIRLQGLIRTNASQTRSTYYIFASMIRCACCGNVMNGTYTINRCGVQYIYYRCNKSAHAGTGPNQYHVPELKRQKWLMEYVKKAVADQIVKVNAVKAKPKKKARRSNRASIEKQLDKLEDLYISDDRMTKEKYEAKKAAILAKLIPDEEPEEKLPELADLEKIQALFDSGIEELYQDFTPEERREFWRGILTEIKMDDRQLVSVNFIE